MAPAQDEIRKRQGELQAIRDQIKLYEQRIKEQLHNEKEVLDLIDSYDRKATLLRKLIAKLHAAEQSIQANIGHTRTQFQKLQGQLDFLKTHYARYVASVYKEGRVHDLELLLSSSSLNQFTIRAEYLRRFSEQRKEDAGKIITKKADIEETQARLERQLSEERRLIAEKAAEEDQLTADVAERRSLLRQIRKDKTLVQREMDRQIKAARDLESLISTLIEAEKTRKEHEKAEGGSKFPQPPVLAGSFESKRGKLRWPVAEGSLVARFGPQRHPTLKTITQNTGIDIAVKAGTPVTAVAEGSVARIWWLPWYGNLIIINHPNGYRTIYTHLDDIMVVEGQKVKEGDIVATSGESVDGPRLHFEIWKDHEKQDPELWLARR